MFYVAARKVTIVRSRIHQFRVLTFRVTHQPIAALCIMARVQGAQRNWLSLYRRKHENSFENTRNALPPAWPISVDESPWSEATRTCTRTRVVRQRRVDTSPREVQANEREIVMNKQEKKGERKREEDKRRVR